MLKAAEDTPATAWIFAKLAHEAGLAAGVLNVIQGLGKEAGAPIVESPDVDVLVVLRDLPQWDGGLLRQQ